MNHNITPLLRILNAKDPITGRQLVWFSKKQKRYLPNLNIPVCRSGEEHLIENYELAKKDNFKGWICHHRLELTLNGEFANSMMDLINMDMYFHRPHFELVWLKRGEHNTLHNSGSKHGMYGRTEDKCTSWKGDQASDKSKKMRERRAKKRALESINIPYESEEKKETDRSPI